MLTQTDLNQIRGIIKEEVKEEVAPVRIGVEALDQKLDRVQADINKKIDKVEAALDQKLDRVQADISEILIALDKHQTKLETRVDRLEVEVGIATS